MPKVIVDEASCTGCGICADVCPMNVIEIIEGKAHPVRVDDCIACRACESQCPQGAITVED